jgi:hypothetical protein
MASNGLEWFRPMWRRVAIVSFCVAWSGWEWLNNHDQTWGFITLLLCGWAIWTFFVSFDRNVGPPPGDNPPPPPSQQP